MGNEIPSASPVRVRLPSRSSGPTVIPNGAECRGWSEGPYGVLKAPLIGNSGNPQPDLVSSGLVQGDCTPDSIRREKEKKKKNIVRLEWRSCPIYPSPLFSGEESYSQLSVPVRTTSGFLLGMFRA